MRNAKSGATNICIHIEHSTCGLITINSGFLKERAKTYIPLVPVFNNELTLELVRCDI